MKLNNTNKNKVNQFKFSIQVLSICSKSSFFFILLYSTIGVCQMHNVEKLATQYDERNPIVSADGKRLYITIAYHPQNNGGVRDSGDIWVSDWLGTQWGEWYNGGNVFNNFYYNGVVGMRNNGRTVMLYNEYNEKNTPGYSLSFQQGQTWSVPSRCMSIDNVVPIEFPNGYYHSTQDIIFFTALESDRRNAEDLFFSKNLGNVWSKPVSLGPVINSNYQETTPYLSEDGNTLFLSSNKPGGFGSYDVYKSQRLADDWTHWSTPENLGSSINTEGSEIYFRLLNTEYALYISTHNSAGYGDIKTAMYKNDQKVIQNNTEVLTISGQVLDSSTRNGISLATISFNKLNRSITTSPEGFFQVDAKVDSVECEILAKGYLPVRLSIKRRSNNSIELQPVTIGSVFTMTTVLFETGTTQLLPDSYDELNAIIAFLQENDNIKIRVEGHTDRLGDKAKNMNLSKLRAIKIKNFFVEHGILAGRIKTSGFGDKHPLTLGSTETERQKNRRVDIRILSDQSK